MGNKEKRKIYGFTRTPDAENKLSDMANPPPPEGTASNIESVIKQMHETRKELKPRRPRFRR